jgi:hypothetical protein
MHKTDPTGGTLPFECAPPELSYPGLSPQLLARVKQLWAAKGLDFDCHWRDGVRSLPGFRALPRVENAPNSAEVDLVFLFDQCILWVRALHAGTSCGSSHHIEGLTPAQWHGLAALSARLTEQLSALRLLALTDLPMPAMQIARSISEDVDMALVLLIRPKLAQRFADCQSVEEANEFWRRHIAGGRVFRTVSEKLYTVGIDHSADTDYAKWRKTVLTTLGAAVHSNALNTHVPTRQHDNVLVNDDSLHFATFRIHELCAFAQLVEPDLTKILDVAGATAANTSSSTNPLAQLAGPLNSILVSQIQRLTAPGTTPTGVRQASKLH